MLSSENDDAMNKIGSTIRGSGCGISS